MNLLLNFILKSLFEIIHSKQQADIGMFDISITYERSKAVDFGSTYTITGYTFVTSLPNNSRNSSFIHKVFEPYVWLSTIFTMLLFYTLLKTISKNSSSEFRFWTLVEIMFMQYFNKKIIQV